MCLQTFRFFIVPFCVASYSSGAGANDSSYLPSDNTLVAIGILSAVTFGILCVLFWWKFTERPGANPAYVNTEAGDTDGDQPVVYSENAPMVDPTQMEAQLTDS